MSTFNNNSDLATIASSYQGMATTGYSTVFLFTAVLLSAYTTTLTWFVSPRALGGPPRFAPPTYSLPHRD